MTTTAHYRYDDDTETRVFHRPDGWTLPALSPDIQDCTTNHLPDSEDMPPCTKTATWKVVELHDMHATVGFWCDTHLPAEQRPATPTA